MIEWVFFRSLFHVFLLSQTRQSLDHKLFWSAWVFSYYEWTKVFFGSFNHVAPIQKREMRKFLREDLKQSILACNTEAHLLFNEELFLSYQSHIFSLFILLLKNSIFFGFGYFSCCCTNNGGFQRLNFNRNVLFFFWLYFCIFEPMDFITLFFEKYRFFLVNWYKSRG